jgi:hypothetical protein
MCQPYHNVVLAARYGCQGKSWNIDCKQGLRGAASQHLVKCLGIAKTVLGVGRKMQPQFVLP